MSAPKLTCKDAIELMADYLESALGEELLGALERHLADCPSCLAYLNTYRKTHALTGEVGRIPMPEEMRERLRRILLDQLTRDHP
jgi:anti-sigma factor RsiW